MGIKSVIGWHSFIDFYNEKFTNIPLWFLLSLFETNIIFYFCLIFIEKYTKCFKIATLICILFIIGIIGFFMGRNNVNIQIFIDTSMTVLPFFAIGYIFRKYTHILDLINGISIGYYLYLCLVVLLTYFPEETLCIQKIIRCTSYSFLCFRNNRNFVCTVYIKSYSKNTIYKLYRKIFNYVIGYPSSAISRRIAYHQQDYQ